jgi:GT2 family glycosyltransferase
MSDYMKNRQLTDVRPELTGTCAAPFLNGGAEELSRHLRTGKFKSVPIRADEVLHFNIRPRRDDFSAVGLHLSLTAEKSVDEMVLELRIYKQNAPIALRTVIKTVKPRSGPYVEPFSFDPIPESREVSYRLVLRITPGIRKTTVLCSEESGSVTVAGSRIYDATQPVALPYYALTIPEDVYLARSARPRVSVLIVTYNSEQYVVQCLNSVMAQDYPNIEVLVVDNNSQDRTAEIVRDAYPNVKLLVLENNVGYCKANNLGLRQCTGELIYVLNPDTVVETGTVTHLVSEISISERIAVVGCRIDTLGSATRYADAFLVGRVIGSAEQFLNDGRRFMAAPCGTSFLIRRPVISGLGYLYDEGFVSDWEDHDLGLRCWLQGYVCIHTPHMGVYHSGCGSFGVHNRKRKARIMRNTLLVYFKNYSFVTFVKAMLRTLLGCRDGTKLLGVIWFLMSLRAYIPLRAQAQKERKISDDDLKVIACGVRALIETESRESFQARDLPFHK